MKKAIQLSRFFFIILFLAGLTAPNCGASPVGIGISFSSKAYWSEAENACLPREKGCCFHIKININILAPGQINGTLEIKQNNEITFSFSKSKGILPETYKELLKNGYFYLNGEGTFSADILRQLGLPSSFKLSGGNYPYTVNGDVLTVTFKY